jgi:hypothetical protein
MKKQLSTAVFSTIASMLISACMSVAAQAAPLVIDTNPTWTGNVNFGWGGSGQSLAVDTVKNTLVSIGLYFDEESFAKTFDFKLSDAANGGTTLFSTSFLVNPGINLISINQALTPGSQVWALLDYNGFLGRTAHFSSADGYAGGNSLFDEVGGFNNFVNFTRNDHRFIAVFDGDVAPTPEPATIVLMSVALLSYAMARRIYVTTRH